MYITVEQIKQHLYIDFEADDAVLEDMINTVEAIIEKYLNVQLADLVVDEKLPYPCLLYTSPSPRDAHESRMPSSA